VNLAVNIWLYEISKKTSSPSIFSWSKPLSTDSPAMFKK
jgi:hypothetical protein